MSVEKVKAYFAGFGMEDRVLEFPVSSATVAEAAAALHCEPCHIAKTLAFLVCETPMVIVMAGDARIDNAKYKARFAKKAKMPAPDEVLTLIGHPVGGVCPFAVPENVNVYLDVSLRRFETGLSRLRQPEQRHRPDAAGAGAVFRLLGVGGCLPRLGRAGGGVTENRLFGGAQLCTPPFSCLNGLVKIVQDAI